MKHLFSTTMTLAEYPKGQISSGRGVLSKLSQNACWCPSNEQALSASKSLLSRSDDCAWLCVTPRCIRQWLQTGSLPKDSIIQAAFGSICSVEVEARWVHILSFHRHHHLPSITQWRSKPRYGPQNIVDLRVVPWDHCKLIEFCPWKLLKSSENHFLPKLSLKKMKWFA